jgi:hypothetical protein
MVKQGIAPRQIELKKAERCQEAADKPKNAGNQPDFSFRERRRSCKIFGRGLGGQENFLIDDMMGRVSLRHKGQLEVVDYPVDHSIFGEESDDLHNVTALRAKHRINPLDLAQHLGPA